MRLSYRNIGLVKKSQIEIEGITVLAAPNDSGKSTISKTLYMFLEVLINYDKEYTRLKTSSIRRLMERLLLLINKTLDRYEIEKMCEYLNQKYSFKLEYDIEFNELVYDRMYFKNVMMDFPDSGIGLSVSAEEYFTDFMNEYIAIVGNKNSQDEIMDILHNILSLYSSTENDKFEAVLKSKISSYFARDIVSRYEDESSFLMEDTDSIPDKKNIISCNFTNRSVEELHFQKQLNEFSSVLYFDSFLDLEAYSKTRVMFGKLGGRTVRDTSDASFMSMIYDEEELNTLRKDLPVQDELLEKINEIIGGKVQNDSPNIVFEKGGNKFSLRNTATGVKIFGALQLLLQNYKLTPEVFIIIDEPETNLHPVWQVKLAELIVLIHKEVGVHFFINSHSSNLIEGIKLYSRLYGVSNTTRFYLVQKDPEGNSVFEDVSNGIQSIYNQLNGSLDLLDEVANEILK